jgi:cytochrome bd-type quinol oxidase subunit 2
MFETLSHFALQQYWWVIISLLASLLVFLFFVQGGQTLIFTLGKNELERAMLIGSLGHKWGLTFTTLVTFGGAFFASFPLFYSTSFGGAYWVWMIILFAFIIQAVAYEFRTKPNNFLGQRTYEAFLIINGAVGTILIGTAVGTFFTGSAFTVEKINLTNVLLGGPTTISVWKGPAYGLEAALNVQNLSLGLAVFFLARVLGILYFMTSVDDENIFMRSRKQLLINSAPFLVFFLLFLVLLLTSSGFTANWNAVAGATGYQLDVYTKTAGINASDLFISEYIEGSSNNKAIEIFNGTGSDVDLSVYSIKKQSNGVGDFGGNLVLTGTLANNSVYVIAHSSASQTILNKANQTIGSSPLDFNGNDAVALYKNNIQIDVVGIVDQTANWGKDITLVRKSNILNPTISYSINDWDSYATDTFDYLGSHTFDGGTTNNYLNGFENKDVGNVIYYNLTGLNSSTKYFYVVRASNDAGTSENSNEIWVTIGAAASTYTGTGNWANGSNWSNGMPGENTNVTIEGFVTVDDIYTCNNFTIAPTGRVTIPETVNQQKGLWIKGDFLIRSDATGAGSFIGIYDQDLNWNYEVQGTTTVERYISGASYAWHLISSPVSNQAIAGDWIPTSTGYDFYAWNEPTQTWLNQKVSANNITHFIPCKGYLVAYEETGATKTFTGTLNDGAQTLGLTVTGATSYYGSNLAGNPYPSSIDWKGNNNAIDKSKLVGYNASEGVKHYIWNDASGNYGVYSDANAGDAGTNGANRYIAPMQGFFVSAASNGSFLINDSARVHSSQAWLKSGNNYEFRLCVNAPQGYGSDELLLEFGHNVSVGSAEKWFSFVPTAPSIYSPIEDKKFSIRYLSIQDETLTIPVSFIAGVDGTYTLTANFASSTYSAIKLEDKITGKVHDLLLTPEYSFSANKSDISERFLLHFTVTYGIENLEENADIQIYSYGNSIYLNNNTDSETLVSVYNITGRQIYQDRVGAGSQHTFTINAPTGLYIVKALTGKSITSRKVFIW